MVESFIHFSNKILLKEETELFVLAISLPNISFTSISTYYRKGPFLFNYPNNRLNN